METKRLKRIKPQPTPVRRMPWRRQRELPPPPQNAQEEVAALLDQFTRAGAWRYPLIPGKASNALAVILSVLITSVTVPIIAVPSPLLILGWLMTLLFVRMLLMRLTASDRQLCTARQLSGSDDVRAIPALVRVLTWPEAGARTAAFHALIRLLPRLQTGDATLLDPATRFRLYRQLGRPYSRRRVELICAILEALGRLGDRRAFGRVYGMANRRVGNAAQQRIQQAARACLSHLNTRLEPAHDCQSLLPPAETAITPDTLPRPASGQTDEAEETLLPAGLAKNP